MRCANSPRRRRKIRSIPAFAAGEIAATGTHTRALPVAACEAVTMKLGNIPLEVARIRFV
ncbi:MAG TPA: hypothetical protein VFE60_12950 [Roseiarcus sp.]|nr:hypothetical protein [Roseiarcus sp.]